MKDNKTFWMGFVAVYVVAQVLGYLLHQVVLQGAYESLAHVWRPEQELSGMMWMFFITSAIYLFAFCFIFTKGYEGKGVAEGVRFGALMGVFSGVMAFDAYVVYPITMGLAFSWLLASIIVFVILGAIFAAIYRPQGRPAMA
jgi:hypothetical protein